MMVNKMACKSHQDHSIIANVTGQLWIGPDRVVRKQRKALGVPSWHSTTEVCVQFFMACLHSIQAVDLL